MLIDAEVLPTPRGMRTKLDRIVVCTETDHQKVIQVLDSLDSATPQLKEITGPYWAERFFLWIALHPESLEETDLVPEAPIVRTIQSGPLLPMPEPHLTEQINELRRHILIDEKLIRRIYHALLAGHVILTSPPGTGKTVLVGRLARLNNST